jgi:hypothetical protein
VIPRPLPPSVPDTDRVPLADRPDLEDAVLHALASGARGVTVTAPETPALRRIAALLDTLSEILATGTFRPSVPATDGLVASERHTRERGAVVFVVNPTGRRVIGAVFPALPEIALNPGEAFAWVHDLPLGASDRYLAAYAGLVKSDAALLHAALRPDPFPGARVIVHGTPGETREVALFNEGRGEARSVTFSAIPQVLPVGVSEIVALPTELAGRTYFPPSATPLLPVLIGPDGTPLWAPDGCRVRASGPVWMLAPDGRLETATLLPLRTAVVRLPVETSGRLDPSQPVWVDGIRADPDDLTLPAGESELTLIDSDSALFLPDGACYALELTARPYEPDAFWLALPNARPVLSDE